MSIRPHKSRNDHATPTQSRPGTPSESRRPSLHNYSSIPSLALHHASMVTAALPPQLSTNKVTADSEPLSSSSSISGDGPTGPLITQSRHDSNDSVHVISQDDSGVRSPIGSSAARSPEEQAADAQRLREHLRLTLTRGNVSQTREREPNQPAIRIPHYEDIAPATERQFFALTYAGKPVFTSHNMDSEETTNIIGVMHALISVFEDDQDKIRCINAPPVRITFMLRPPVYYACVSSHREPESVTRAYLEHLHLLILSVITSTPLERILKTHANYDLRRLLSGTTSMLQAHLRHIPTSFSMLTSSLHTMRIDSDTRTRVGEILVPTSKMKARLKDALYAMIIVGNEIVTIVRPKRHTIHPADLHVLLATIRSPAVKASTESLVPICLPKFKASSFLHMNVLFLEDTISELATSQDEDLTLTRPTALVLVSSSPDSDPVREWSKHIITRLQETQMLSRLVSGIRASPYTVGELAIPGLRHFMFKSRVNVQVTMPIFEAAEEDNGDAEEGLDWHGLFSLYSILWDAIHAKSGQECTLRLQYIRTSKICVMGWITQTFEIYLALSPRLPKSAAVGAANAVVKWIKQEEGRLFLKDAPTF